MVNPTSRLRSRLMTIKQVLTKYHEVEIDILLAFVLKKSREFLYLWPNHKLTQRQTNQLTRMVQRRIEGEPVAYLVGYKDFYGLRFKVTKDTLIPRPETEELVNKVLQVCKVLKVKSKLRILDVGTGSGCIIISLAKGLSAKGQEKTGTFFASDVSLKALKVAKENAKSNGVKIQFIQSNLLEKVKIEFDVLVANLPYLSPKWKHRTIRYEPKGALFTKEKGLFLIHELLEQITNKKTPPKFVFLEFDPRQKLLLSNLIKKTLPNSRQKFYKDLAGKWRMVKIELN